MIKNRLKLVVLTFTTLYLPNISPLLAYSVTIYIVWFVSISWYSLVIWGCLSFFNIAVSLNIFVKFSSSNTVLSIILIATCNKSQQRIHVPLFLSIKCYNFCSELSTKGFKQNVLPKIWHWNYTWEQVILKNKPVYFEVY